MADSYVDQLVAGEQIQSSWRDAERMQSVERELFLFLTPQGDFLGASHLDE